MFKSTKIARVLVALAAGFTATLPGLAQANSDVYIFQDEPDAQELNSALFGGDEGEPMMFRTRGIRVQNKAQPAYAPAGTAGGMAASQPSYAPATGGMTAPAASRPVAPIRVAAAPAAPARQPAPQKASGGATVAYLIKFDYNSSVIRPEFHGHLDKLAAALKMPNADGKVLQIMGHTDASGSAEYNRSLSVQRAEAVRNYLIAQHGLSPARLAVIGMGEDLPLADRPGNDPLNRRVEFKAL